MEFSVKKCVVKGAKYLIIFVIPFLVDWFIVEMPDYANLTLGGILVMLANYLKIKVGLRLIP